MGILDGRRRRGGRGAASSARTAAADHLGRFLASRRGVEQRTSLTRPSRLLIAYDGEWTRRSVPSVAWARRFAEAHGLPCYAGVVSYPQRMRDVDRRARGRVT